MGSFPHHNFTKKGNKQAKTKYKRKIPMDLGNTINSLLQLSALPATYTREVHWLAAGSSESMADCMLGFCMGDFCYLLVGANLKVLCWSSFAFQKIQVIRPLNCELWKYLSFSIPFAVNMVWALFVVSFSWELQIFQMNSYGFSTHKHTLTM